MHKEHVSWCIETANYKQHAKAGTITCPAWLRYSVRTYLAVNQLYDVGLVAQALQEIDLVDEAAGGLCIPPCQADAL
jgi:ABC-type spermidine/putrescine transport system permease subunit I